MNDNYIVYAIILALSLLIALFLTFYTWKRRKVPGALYVSMALMGVTLWSFCGINQVMATTLVSNVFWSQISYIGVVIIAPTWFLFAVTYTQNEKWITKSRLFLLMVIPSIVLAMVFTNQWYGLIWPHVTAVSTVSGTVFVYDHGIGAWFNIIYSYALMILGIILLFQTVINSPGLYRYQAGLLLVGVVVPLLLNAVYLADLFPDPGVDPTPFAFFITGLVSAWSLFKFRFLNIMPVAHTALFNNMGGGIIVLDAENRIIETNPAANELLGINGDVMGQSADSVIKNIPDFVFPTDETRKHYEARLEGPNHYWLDVRIKPLHSKDTLLGHLVSLTDITRTKLTEERVQKAMEEKELLMKEIHHRVKNNLMVISSLLNLESRNVKNEEARNILKESRNRANSMALIHERLYGFSDLKNINFGEYTKSLTQDLFRNYAVDMGNIKLDIDTEDIQLDVDIAVPLGLVLNELVSNCLKYAFPANKKGTLKIIFKKEDDKCILTVKDDGVGIPDDIDVKKTDTLGLTLIRSLVEQIEGNLTITSDHGTEVNITFPEGDYQ